MKSTDPDVPGLLRLADFFDVSLDYLMGRSDVREVQKPSELSAALALGP